jgi:hypothetical protein
MSCESANAMFSSESRPRHAFSRLLSSFARHLRLGDNPKRPVPSGEEKRAFLLETSRRFGREVFIETGTFLGDTVEYLKPYFRQIVSVELSEELADRARLRFESDANVRIVQGDSAIALVSILDELREPALFWLDGHYSHTCVVNGDELETAHGDTPTPILRELTNIFSHGIRNHVVIIDDARLFSGNWGYPTLREIETLATNSGWQWRTELVNDMILLIPLESE